MNTKLRAFALLFTLVALSSLAFGQATMQSTTLSAAVLDATTAAAGTNRYVLSVASCTNILAPALEATQGGIGYGAGNNYYLLFIDRELFRVNAVNSAVSPCQVTVERGFYGTKTTGHASGVKVWTGPANYYDAQDAGAGLVEPVAGTPCTASTQRVLPKLSVATGRAWNCATSTTSTVQLWSAFDPGVPVVEGAVLALSTAGTTIAPTNPLHHVSGTSSAFATITVPAALAPNGCLALIPDAVWTSTASGGNIAVASTAIVNKVMTFCYDSVNSKWVPSY